MPKRRVMNGLRRGTARFAATLLLMTSLGGLPALPSRAGETHVLRFTDGVDVTTLDPLLSNVSITADLGALTMAHFVRYDRANRPIPELIETIPTRANGGISADGRTITYHLRRGVRWSDGAPFDADDVVFTLRAILNPKNNISLRDAWDRLSGFDAPDKFTVRLHLKAAYGSFLSRYFGSDSLSCVLPKHLLANLATINQTPYNALPVGIGPFRYTAFHRGDAIEMEANPFYFRGLPKLHKIVYKLITDENTILAQVQSGELDLWGTVGGTFYDRVRALPGVDVIVRPSQFMSGVYLNTSRPGVADPAVRRALLLATDRHFILEKINKGAGTLSQSVVPSISEDYAALPLTPYDPRAAELLLDSAGWKPGADGIRAKGGTRLAITIVLPTGYLPSQITAEFLRAAWQKLGVDVETKPYADGQYFAPASEGGILTTGRFDAALLSESGDHDADVTPLYGCAYAPPRGNNLDHFCDRETDVALADYERSFDSAARSRAARRFQSDIDRATPTIVLYERGFIYASSKRVHGFDPNDFGAYDDMSTVDVDSR